MTAQALLALDALAGDAHPDATPPQMLPTASAVVGFVRMELVGPAPGPAGLALDRWQRIDHLLEHHRVMPVRARDAEHHWRAIGVGQHMALGAEFAPVGRVRPGVRPPRGLATLEPSMHMRLWSSASWCRSCSSSSMCSPCHAPASCHCWSRRQHVMPLPQPSACGSSSQGIPVRRTYTMPLSASWSSMRGRPPRGLAGFGAGSSGRMRSHSSALISCCFIPSASLGSDTTGVWFC